MPSQCVWWDSLHCSRTKCCEFITAQIAKTQTKFPEFLILDTFLQVHGAFAGYSGITVGICNTHYVYFPIPEVISHSRQVDSNSRMWHRCLTSTGQPDFFWFMNFVYSFMKLYTKKVFMFFIISFLSVSYHITQSFHNVIYNV